MIYEKNCLLKIVLIWKNSDLLNKINHRKIDLAWTNRIAY
jgi:hypothetical protein